MSVTESFESDEFFSFRKATDVMNDVLAGLTNSRQGTTIKTGITYFDRFCGLPRKGITLIAARPDMLQNEVAMHLTMMASKQSQQPLVIAWFSLQHRVENLAIHLLSSAAKVRSTDIEPQTVNRDQKERLTSAARNSLAEHIYLDDISSGSIDDIDERCMGAGHLDIVVIDGLRDMQKSDDLEYLMPRLHTLATRSDVALILFDRINYELEVSLDKPLIKDDLLNYPEIRPYIDLLLILQRPELLLNTGGGGDLWVDVARNMAGTTGGFRLHFDKFRSFRDDP